LKDYLLPFVIALAVFTVGFLGLDLLIMNLQGLGLFFHG
jgi:hypothetical protein